jgi:hypothetical protein
MRVLLAILGGAGLVAAYSPIAAAPRCALPGETIQWVADFCMAKMETDDEIAVSDCIERERKRLPNDACAAKTRMKRAMCTLAIARGHRSDGVERCVADRGYMGTTVERGGVGGR